MATNSLANDYFYSHSQIPSSSTINVYENNLNTSNDHNANTTAFRKILSILSGIFFLNFFIIFTGKNFATPLPESASQTHVPMPNDSVSNFNASLADVNLIESQTFSSTNSATNSFHKTFFGLRNFIRKSFKRSDSNEDNRNFSSNMSHVLLEEEDDSTIAVIHS